VRAGGRVGARWRAGVCACLQVKISRNLFIYGGFGKFQLEIPPPYYCTAVFHGFFAGSYAVKNNHTYRIYDRPPTLSILYIYFGGTTRNLLHTLG